MKPGTASSELRSALGRLAPHYRRALLLSLVIGLLSLMPTLYMLEVYDRVVNSRSLVTLAMLTLLAVGAYSVMEALDWVRSRLLHQAGLELDDALAERVFEAVFRISLQRGGAVAQQQAFGDLRMLREFLGSPAVLALLETPLVFVMLLLLYLIHPWLCVAALSGAAIQVAIAYLTERRTQPPLSQANRAANAAQNYASSCLDNAQVIESMGMLEGVERRWRRRQHEFLDKQAQASNHAGSLSALAKSVQMVQGSALLGLGCWLMLQGELAGSGGMMIVGSIFGGKVLQPLVQLVAHWKEVVGARDALGRLEEMLTQVPAPPPRMPLPAPNGSLSVEAVTAGAPGSPLPILRGITFALAPGQCLAIVGPSASGKTTLARVLTGIWPAMAGKVRLDGVDVFTWDKAELGPHVGYLPQSVDLFDGTLAENIARFGTVDRAAVETAARLAGLEDVVAELPEGFDSRIGELGAFLSGGQRQRVGLARAIYGNPRLVVLDEPNSSLDERGETVLLQLLGHLKAQGTTVVMITHRTNVLAAADAMLVLVAGTVQAFGPRDKVLAALAAKTERAQQPAAPSPQVA